MGKLPLYKLLSQDDWNSKIEQLYSIAKSCDLCPRSCKVNRINGETGFCGAPGSMVISSIFPHHGEEPPISGEKGSGTVFFSHCTLKCIFCQNYQISHQFEGKKYSPQELATQMLWLQEQGCHNINLVTATHFLPWIIESLKLASESGLEIPIVYNNGGYESLETLRVLEGLIDIYLPDMKYGDPEPATKYSGASDYVEVNKLAIKEMFRQVGPLKIDYSGIAYRGLCIRHLVLPHDESFSWKIRNYLLSNYDPSDIYMSLMAQYRPVYGAKTGLKISSSLNAEDYQKLRDTFINDGFEGFFQELETMDTNFLIDFTKRKKQALTGEEKDWEDLP